MRAPNLRLFIALVAMLSPLRAYTVNNAWAANGEGLRGSIAPGKLADLVVLDRDPFTAEPDELRDPEVRGTIVGGEVVWRHDEYRPGRARVLEAASR
jgi:predicted amidohydrolase YtcJ